MHSSVLSCPDRRKLTIGSVVALEGCRLQLVDEGVAGMLHHYKKLALSFSQILA